jgi:NADPH:quinone reductase-like Zn-dependent oxidoreductase
MRAVWIRKHGDASVLEVRETEDPQPGPGEVRIRVRAAGLNFAEVSARQGMYPPAPKPPCIVGYEGSGVIDALGEGVTQRAIDTRVMFLSRFGGHSDTVCVPWYQAAAVPDSMSFEHAAAMPVTYLTAYQMLFRVRRIAPGDRVLVHSAAGGVGTAVLQLCRTVEGITTFGTASARKHDYARSQGCDHPIDYHTTDYVAAVRELTNGEGIDLVCDALGGKDFAKGYSLLRPGGMLICFGLANAQKPGRVNWFRVVSQVLKTPKFGGLKLMSDNRAVAGVDLGSLWGEHAMIERHMATLVELYEQKKIEPHVDVTVPFANAKDAHERLERGEAVGKVLLVP